MQRLSRAEAQVRTRELIVASATELFLRDGFTATSLEAVAAHAGFTRGAVYSNFAGKVALGSAVIDALYERETDRVLALAEAARADGLAAVIASVDAWGRTIVGDRAWFRLEMAVAATNAEDGGQMAATASRYERIRAATATLVKELEAAHGLELPVDAETLALGLFSLILGLGMQRATDPSVSTDVVAVFVQRLLGE
ncbi:TetR/AcrR family transcriptional regulator [Tsukamurella sp. M9C]|uniref:TetR/AcrR family transcriptional regulator n=1 Tax=Tsukamurella sp. M9C TaxID=2877520 RepID=UPI001CD0215E|nr:TetR/AcrR family transcriptional regulator [Tsukamurella sp. M9C]MCA0156695.1 TetR/AcrR family transcriptional regulator [Tsukamurella sp. M9C]